MIFYKCRPKEWIVSPIAVVNQYRKYLIDISIDLCALKFHCFFNLFFELIIKLVAGLFRAIIVDIAVTIAVIIALTIAMIVCGPSF